MSQFLHDFFQQISFFLSHVHSTNHDKTAPMLQIPAWVLGYKTGQEVVSAVELFPV